VLSRTAKAWVRLVWLVAGLVLLVPWPFVMVGAVGRWRTVGIHRHGANGAPGPPGWVIVAISVFFGLFYAYFVWNAIAFLVSQATGPLGLNGTAGSCCCRGGVPARRVRVAFAIGWRRAWWEFALVLLAGLGLVAVFWLNVVAYSVTNGASLLG
jgi:hypothetical protein